MLALEERNDWLEAGKEDYKKRLQSEAAEADRLRRRVDDRAAFNWRDPTVLAAVGQLGGSFDDVGESAQAWPAPARFGDEAPTE